MDEYQQNEDDTAHLPLWEQQARDMWWEEPGNLRRLAEYLDCHGWTLAEFAESLDEPWHLDAYWQAAIGRTDYPQ